MPERALTSAQIGRAGELLVQYRLLLLGVESAPMTTDAGVDLVAYSPVTGAATTVQVKTNLGPKPAGGKGKSALDWWVPADAPSELIALVDLSEQRVWALKTSEVEALTQQHSGGRHHLYMYTDLSSVPRKPARMAHANELQRYLLENRAHALFGI